MGKYKKPRILIKKWKQSGILDNIVPMKEHSPIIKLLNSNKKQQL